MLSHSRHMFQLGLVRHMALLQCLGHLQYQSDLTYKRRDDPAMYSKTSLLRPNTQETPFSLKSTCQQISSVYSSRTFPAAAYLSGRTQHSEKMSLGSTDNRLGDHSLVYKNNTHPVPRSSLTETAG